MAYAFDTAYLAMGWTDGRTTVAELLERTAERTVAVDVGGASLAETGSNLAIQELDFKIASLTQRRIGARLAGRRR